MLEVLREEEFAPVKNPPGTKEDSPDSARELISRLHQNWLKDYEIKFNGKSIINIKFLINLLNEIN